MVDILWSTELETSLSSFEDHKALEITSPSIPYKAWDVCCVLKGKDKGRIRSRFQFPSSVRISGKYLDYDKKLVEAQSGIVSLFAKNEFLTIQISALADEAKKDKDYLKTLEKNINTEKVFSKLKDKQINEALTNVEKVGFEAVEKFKASNEFSNKLYDYYVDGFKLFRKYLAKHHPKMDFSQLDMEEVEKEVLADHPSKVATEGILEDRPSKVAMEGEVAPGVVESIPTNPSLSSPS
nr:hypothetical protein CFP56_10837 [Quercus suber]